MPSDFEPFAEFTKRFAANTGSSEAQLIAERVAEATQALDKMSDHQLEAVVCAGISKLLERDLISQEGLGFIVFGFQLGRPRAPGKSP